MGGFHMVTKSWFIQCDTSTYVTVKGLQLGDRDPRKILYMNITHVMCQGSKISSLEVASSAWRLLRVVVVLQVVLDTLGKTCSEVTAITFNGWRTVSLWRSQWFLWRTIGFRDRASWSRGSEMHHVMTSCDHLLHFRCRVSTHAAHWNNEQPFRVQFVGWGRNCGECGQTFGRAVKLQTHVKRHHYERLEARGNDLPVGDTGE